MNTADILKIDINITTDILKPPIAKIQSEKNATRKVKGRHAYSLRFPKQLDTRKGEN